MLGLFALVAVAQVQPGEIHGAIYALEGQDAGPKLFDIVRRTRRTKHGWVSEMEFRDASGGLAVEERVEFGEDVQPTVYWRKQHQTGGRGRVHVRGDEIRYEWRDRDGRVYRDSETTDESLMIGPMMFAYFQHHWSKIEAGEALKFRVMVPDRRTSYSFEFQKVDDVTRDGRPLAKCELRLTGLLGLFVGDMTFYLDARNGGIVRYTGMVLPKTLEDGEWKNVKGVVRYAFGKDNIARKPEAP